MLRFSYEFLFVWFNALFYALLPWYCHWRFYWFSTEFVVTLKVFIVFWRLIWEFWVFIDQLLIDLILILILIYFLSFCFVILVISLLRLLSNVFIWVLFQIWLDDRLTIKLFLKFRLRLGFNNKIFLWTFLWELRILRWSFLLHIFNMTVLYLRNAPLFGLIIPSLIILWIIWIRQMIIISLWIEIIEWHKLLCVFINRLILILMFRGLVQAKELPIFFKWVFEPVHKLLMSLLPVI